jgi:hypothetical protein
VNNTFSGWTGGCAIVNSATDVLGSSIVRLNSFLSTDRIAVRNGSSTATSIDVANNFRGTTDPTVVDAMIFDRSDSLLECCTINYDPVLSAPDTATPR